MVGGHAQGLDEELHGLVDAVLVVETQAAHVQCVSVGRVHPQDITGEERAERNHMKPSEDEEVSPTAIRHLNAEMQSVYLRVMFTCTQGGRVAL